MASKNIIFSSKIFFPLRKPFVFLKTALGAEASGMVRFTKERLVRNRKTKPLYESLAVKYRFFRSSMRPHKSPRVFVKRGMSRMEFFQVLHQRGVEHVLLRWWENLPEMPAGEDMDILIKDDHRDLIADLVTFTDNNTGLKCDIYTITGSKHGSHKSLPYFQTNLAHSLIRTRTLYKGAFVPSPVLYFASLAYHAIFHKGEGSGLSGFGGTIKDLEHDYTSILKELASKSGLDVEITVNGLFQWLRERDFVPADDTLAKLVDNKPELSFLQKRLFSDVRGGELLVYLVRERLLKEGFLDDFEGYLKNEFHFDVIDVRILNQKEKEICTARIRGGKWDKGPFRYSGGPPVAMVVAFDYHPYPLEPHEQKRQSRMTNRNNLSAKYGFRERLNMQTPRKSHYNGVHSADNEQDAKTYISLIGTRYENRILKKIEYRRQRYAGIWNVKKVLSKGKMSKVELIEHPLGLAVKKTFRPGGENLLRRELYAAKELSKHLSFIPPLLEEGHGFLITPYFENILDQASDLEKKEILASKASEIVGIINNMHNRGLAFINFTPESLIITPENKLFCTGFSYLQKYSIFSSNIEEAYEITGLPKAYPGDYPDHFHPDRSSFREVWSPFIGSWKNHLKMIDK